MQFLQHFLPGQPLEENEQTSGGLIVNHARSLSRLDLDLGAQAEYMTGSLREFQAGPTTGSAFLIETRPPGLHYDYDVDSLLGAVFYNMVWNATDRTRIVHSLRLEHLAYDYDNHHLVGNTRDDGTTCGFGGCLYTRPASREDEFTNVAVRLGFETEVLGPIWYGTASTGFRPPQATELYRLRGGQTVADLDSEDVYSVESGLKGASWNVAVFGERTRNLILRDAEAFNVSNGKTKSVGVEVEAWWQAGAHSISVAATYARHRYAFDRLAEGLEVIEDGNEIDTAPRWLANVRWAMQFSERLNHELELNVVGQHYVNADNSARYDGHYVLNWRGQWQVSEALQIYARVINLLDERYADRADFAFGNYRYFPAMPRQLYLGLRYDLR
jgi:outer membrane receptor protein involved in Fe transport